MPAAFPDYGQPPSLSEPGPARAIVSVTPADATDLPKGTCRGFHVNVAGNVSIDDCFGNSAVVLTVAAGVPIPYAAKRIRSTGTTATGIFALY